MSLSALIAMSGLLSKLLSDGLMVLMNLSALTMMSRLMADVMER